MTSLEVSAANEDKVLAQAAGYEAGRKNLSTLNCPYPIYSGPHDAWLKGWNQGQTTIHTLLAVDPGTTQSGFVILENDRVLRSGVLPNPEALTLIRSHRGALAIEAVASYGMAVGKEVFETVRWIGRFQQVYRDPEAVSLIYRRDVKLYLCGSAKAKDSNVRQALLDLFPSTGGGKTPQIGTKASPGPLFGVSSHAWAALGVALTAAHGLQQS